MGRKKKLADEFEKLSPDELWQFDLELAKREARAGNPWNFVRLQWPGLVCKPEERRFFSPVIAADGTVYHFRLDDFQIDMVGHAFAGDHCEAFVKGAVKRGKGYAAALIINIWFDIWPDPNASGKNSGCKIILAGPSTDHVKNNLFTEVVTVRKQMVKPCQAEVLTEAIRAEKNHYVIIANPDSNEGFSGQHSGATLFVFDEASGASDMHYSLATTQARFILALSNPRVLSGWFHDGYRRADDTDITQSVPTPSGMRRLVTALGSTATNVREKRLERMFSPHDGFTVLDKTFGEGRPIPKALYEEVALLVPAQMDYARYYRLMQSPDPTARRVLGEGQFPKEDASLQVIMASWLEHHKRAWTEDMNVVAFGLDVGASKTGDPSILAAGGPQGCAQLHPFNQPDTMKTVDWVLKLVEDNYGLRLTDGVAPIAVDYGGGYGRSPGDRLRELGCMVIAVHPSKRSRNPLRYANTRCELYGELAERLNPTGLWGEENPWGLPPDQELIEELTAQEKMQGGDGIKIQLIPKQKPYPQYEGKTVRGAIGRSPDKADAVALLWRAISTMALTSDFSDRHLVLTLDAPSVDEEELDAAEKWKRERDKHLSHLAAVMDGEDGSPLWR